MTSFGVLVVHRTDAFYTPSVKLSCTPSGNLMGSLILIHAVQSSNSGMAATDGCQFTYFAFLCLMSQMPF